MAWLSSNNPDGTGTRTGFIVQSYAPQFDIWLSDTPELEALGEAQGRLATAIHLRRRIVRVVTTMEIEVIEEREIEADDKR